MILPTDASRRCPERPVRPERRRERRHRAVPFALSLAALSFVTVVHAALDEPTSRGGIGAMSTVQIMDDAGFDQPIPAAEMLVPDGVFFHCASALLRSNLWAPRPADEPRPVPSTGAMLAALTDGEIDGQRYDAELPARQRGCALLVSRSVNSRTKPL